MLCHRLFSQTIFTSCGRWFKVQTQLLQQLVIYCHLDPLSISTWFLKYRVSLDFFQFQTRKKIDFETNLIFCRVRTWYFKISISRNWFLNSIIELDFLSIWNLILAGYSGSKNQVRTLQKIKFVSKSIFFRVYNKLPNWHFKNQAQIDTAHC